jgi:hypothetical protein
LPEQYYAFIGVALVWQFAFLPIASDVNRYRPLMVLAMLEMFLASGAAIWLFALSRIDSTTLAPFLVDAVMGLLFIASYVRSSERFLSLSGGS